MMMMTSKAYIIVLKIITKLQLCLEGALYPVIIMLIPLCFHLMKLSVAALINIMFQVPAASVRPPAMQKPI